MKITTTLLLLFFLAITNANARELCTPDAQFTLCAWGQLRECKLLDEKLLQSEAFTKSEREIIIAVRKHTTAERIFNFRSLVQEFGSKVSKVSPIPSVTMLAWIRDTPGSKFQTTIGFTAENERILIADVSVVEKFVARWCAKLPS